MNHPKPVHAPQTHFGVFDNCLQVGGIALTRLAQRVGGTPFFAYDRSLPDRMLGCGTLIIESASDEPLEFDDIPSVEKVHTMLYREVNDNPDDNFYPGVFDGRA